MNGQVSTILIAEDDDNEFIFFERAAALERFDADVRRARDGVEAIAYLLGEGQFANRQAYPLPKLVVLDLNMPRQGGFDVLTFVRHHPELKFLPVIIFTSSQKPRDMRRAYDLGANAYLVKPSSYLSYFEVVRKLKGFLLNGVEPPSERMRSEAAIEHSQANGLFDVPN